MTGPFDPGGDMQRLTAGALCAGAEPVSVENSVGSAAVSLIDYGVAGLPVCRDGIVVGLVTEAAITKFLAEGGKSETAVSEIMVPAQGLSGSASWSECLRAFDESGLPALPVVDAAGRVIGVLTPSRLIGETDRDSRPKMLGGMATPFGVYLSTGAVSGGVSKWALVAAGGLLLATFLVGAEIALAVAHMVPRSLLAHPLAEAAIHGLGLLMFFVLLRSQRISKFHAAEHMVVHAVEQNEPLAVEAVSRMPRVHPRCGTNLAVASMVFLGLFSTPWVADQELRLLVAMLATLFSFRPLGAFVQTWFTTRPAGRSEIEAGIRSGKDLLANYQSGRHVSVPVWMRLWNSGLFHVMAGSMLAATVAGLLFEALRVPLDWRVL